LRSRSYLFLLLVLGLALGSWQLLHWKPTNWGLDVRGGVRIVYQMDPNDLKGRNPDDLAPRILKVLQSRVASNLGVVEGNVARKGTDQFIVELPGFTDEAAALKVLGTAASLKFYDATNVTTSRDNFRPYTEYNGSNDPKNPQVWFRQTTGNSDPIKPGTPEYLAVIAGWGEPKLVGDDLDKAQPTDQGGNMIPQLFFSPAGAQKMENWTRSVLNKKEKLAAVLDNVVLSAPEVQDGQILKDSCVIEGKFDPDYVVAFCDILNAGALPVNINVAGTENIDPSIGQSALKQMFYAGEIAFAVISVFMLAYYGFPGVIAIIALALYVLFTVAVLRAVNATFSLAAIAGFVLSVGMAVDANILVFERFKEEIKAGKNLHTAITLGFKRAFSAIADSNACTIITSGVLYTLGTGNVKGFAFTLVIGVIISLFTAFTVTRSLLMFFIDSGIASNPKLYALNHNWFKNIESRANDNPIRVIETRKTWFILSLITILVFVPFTFLGGFKLNVEFRGGYETDIVNRLNLSRDQIESSVVKVFPGANVKMARSATESIAIVSVPPEAGNSKSATDSIDVANRIATAAGYTAADVKSPSFVGPTIQKEMINAAILGVLISSALIVIYLAARFGFAVGNFGVGLRFGFSAILALLHDILVVIGITAFFGYIEHWEISSLFITSMLTVIGFSVHDTIVIFDRIRENLKKPNPGEAFEHLMDRSITQSFARSINTSGTVVVTLFILLFVGSTTPDLKLFCVTMLAGIISGTYSSIYNASPILYLWDKMVGAKKGEAATLLGAARQDAANQRILTPQMTVADPSTPGTPGRSYGQVRRRASSQAKRGTDIEEP